MSFVLILVSGTSLITADMAAGFLAVLQRSMSASRLLPGPRRRVRGQYDRRTDLRGHLWCRQRLVAGRLRTSAQQPSTPRKRRTVLHRTASRAIVDVVPAHFNVHVLPGPLRRRQHAIRVLGPFAVCDRRHPARHRKRRFSWAPDAPRGALCLRTAQRDRLRLKLPSHDAMSFIRRSATNTRKNHPPSS